jgi:F0F1-type ATP synthase epsilon subunit
MPEPLRLTVLAPTQTLLDVERVTRVQAHLADGGPIGIYPGHVPLLAETVAAPLRYTDDAGEHALEVEAGVLHVGDGSVTVYIVPSRIQGHERNQSNEGGDCAT